MPTAPPSRMIVYESAAVAGGRVFLAPSERWTYGRAHGSL
jgi:hypothetical protein